MSEEFVPSQALFPFTSRWFEGEVGPVHYIDEGAGPKVVVLLHGNPTWSFLHRHVIRRLCDGGLRCVAMDMPGHGLSAHPAEYGYTAAEQARVVLSLWRALDLRDVIVVAQDWGGPIGLWAATEEPERVAGVALGYTFAWPPTGLLVGAVAWAMRTAWGQRKIAGDGFVAWVLRSQLRVPLDEETLRHYTAPHADPSRRRSLRMLPVELSRARPWLLELEARVRERLADRPALLFSGGWREAFVGSPTRRFQSLLPDHEVVQLGRAGHFFPEDDPELVAKAILRRFAAPVVSPHPQSSTGSSRTHSFTMR